MLPAFRGRLREPRAEPLLEEGREDGDWRLRWPGGIYAPNAGGRWPRFPFLGTQCDRTQGGAHGPVGS
jgi:hypothetical protein